MKPKSAGNLKQTTSEEAETDALDAQLARSRLLAEDPKDTIAMARQIADRHGSFSRFKLEAQLFMSPVTHGSKKKFEENLLTVSDPGSSTPFPGKGSAVDKADEEDGTRRKPSLHPLDEEMMSVLAMPGGTPPGSRSAESPPASAQGRPHEEVRASASGDSRVPPAGTETTSRKTGLSHYQKLMDQAKADFPNMSLEAGTAAAGRRKAGGGPAHPDADQGSKTS